MLTRFLMMFAVILMLGACSSTDDQAMVDESKMAQESVDSSGFNGSDLQGPIPGTQEDLLVNVGDRVFFGYDRYDLTAEAQSLLDAQAKWLQQYPNLAVTIEGHADERGTREYNLALGERRANAVKNYLVALGVDALRLNVISFGKERPAVPGSNESAWAQNRRAVTKVE